MKRRRGAHSLRYKIKREEVRRNQIKPPLLKIEETLRLMLTQSDEKKEVRVSFSLTGLILNFLRYKIKRRFKLSK